MLSQKSFSVARFREGNEVLGELQVRTAGNFFDLFQNGTAVARSQTPELLCELICFHIHSLMAQHSKEWTFIRGDSVVTKTGEAIVLAGGDFTGQSALAKSLIRKGCQAWSHHLVGIDDDGKVINYPSPDLKTLSVRAVTRIDYVRRANWFVSDVTPGKMAFSFIPLAQTNPNDMEKALERIASLTNAAHTRLLGQRGELPWESRFLDQLGASNRLE